MTGVLFGLAVAAIVAAAIFPKAPVKRDLMRTQRASVAAKIGTKLTDYLVALRRRNSN